MKLGIVNDMPLAVEALRRVVSEAGHEVIWVAGNGEEAVRKCADKKPDLVLMDLIMPVMDGVESTRRIMAASPCAILVVTSTVAGSYQKVYEAMALGALDAVDTPTAQGGAQLLAKIATIAKLVQAPATPPRPHFSAHHPHPRGRAKFPLLAIGASTGGPRAVADVLSSLGTDFPAAIAIVQHVDVHFAPGLATWLTAQSGWKVELARMGSQLQPGVAFLACTTGHMVMATDGTLGYTTRPVSFPYRPSADVFFKSVAAVWQPPAAGVLLTGMGRDGAEGLLRLREEGWLTIAQDEASSVVYGMPRAAIEAKAAVKILDIHQIGPAVASYFKR